ncbi:AlpA family phage regulatory protein [Escherichia coli]|nr:AlpA family phage regulatory protein [Escherichia coli]
MNSDRFLRLRQVEDKIGFGKSRIYRQIQLQQFPQSIRLNSRHVAWLESEVDAWIH